MLVRRNCISSFVFTRRGPRFRGKAPSWRADSQLAFRRLRVQMSFPPEEWEHRSHHVSSPRHVGSTLRRPAAAKAHGPGTHAESHRAPVHRGAIGIPCSRDIADATCTWGHREPDIRDLHGSPLSLGSCHGHMRRHLHNTLCRHSFEIFMIVTAQRQTKGGAPLGGTCAATYGMSMRLAPPVTCPEGGIQHALRQKGLGLRGRTSIGTWVWELLIGVFSEC